MCIDTIWANNNHDDGGNDDDDDDEPWRSESRANLPTVTRSSHNVKQLS